MDSPLLACPAPTWRRPLYRGFTLVELLVVVGIITILTTLMVPILLIAIDQSHRAACIGHLRQVGQAFVGYYKDYDQWMVCCGNEEGQLTNRVPFIEPPVDLAAASAIVGDGPFWYGLLAPYVNPAATVANAIASYRRRTGSTVDPTGYALHDELARLCMLYQCPSKKQSHIGYGYNYCAPFGESRIYPRLEFPDEYPQDCYLSEIPPLVGDDALRAAFVPKEFCWPYSKGNQWLRPAWYRNFPCYQGGEPAPVPILWYSQSAHFSVITGPARQIAVCDTGLVINDPDPAGVRHPPSEWLEHSSGQAAVNWTGYVRFPICQDYVSRIGPFSLIYPFGSPKPTPYYEWYTDDPDGVVNGAMNRAWRPVPRHNSKTCCLFFDGSVATPDVERIVSYEWGERECLFDNTPSQKPPAAKWPEPPGNPLPARDVSDPNSPDWGTIIP